MSYLRISIPILYIMVNMSVSERILCQRIDKFFYRKSRRDNFKNIHNTVLKKIVKLYLHIILKI